MYSFCCLANFLCNCTFGCTTFIRSCTSGCTGFTCHCTFSCTDFSHCCTLVCTVFVLSVHSYVHFGHFFFCMYGCTYVFAQKVRKDFARYAKCIYILPILLGDFPLRPHQHTAIVRTFVCTYYSLLHLRMLQTVLCR